MLLNSFFIFWYILSIVSATFLYVSSYLGTITTLELEKEDNGYSLEAIAVDFKAPQNTSFLVLNRRKSVVYSVEEGLDVKDGYLATYETTSWGALHQIDRHVTLNGPVHQVVYNHGKALAVAH